MIRNLKRGRQTAWKSLQPAFSLAIATAREVEYEAHRAANLSGASVDPAYPPWVTLLAKSGVTLKGERG